MNQFPPGPLILPYIGQYFFLIMKIFAAQGAPPVRMWKIFYLDPIGKQFTLKDIFYSKKFVV